MRWEGDLFYLYIRKYRYNLRPRLLGWRNFFYVLFNGLVLQIVMPFVIVAYTLALFWVLSARLVSTGTFVMLRGVLKSADWAVATPARHNTATSDARRMTASFPIRVAGE